MPAHGILDRRPVALSALRAALDIGERERDRAGRASRHDAVGFARGRVYGLGDRLRNSTLTRRGSRFFPRLCSILDHDDVAHAFAVVERATD